MRLTQHQASVNNERETPTHYGNSSVTHKNAFNNASELTISTDAAATVSGQADGLEVPLASPPPLRINEEFSEP